MPPHQNYPSTNVSSVFMNKDLKKALKMRCAISKQNMHLLTMKNFNMSIEREQNSQMLKGMIKDISSF